MRHAGTRPPGASLFCREWNEPIPLSRGTASLRDGSEIWPRVRSTMSAAQGRPFLPPKLAPTRSTAGFLAPCFVPDPAADLDKLHCWHPFTQHAEWCAPGHEPLVLVEGRGAVLRDSEGREYIDGNSSIWTNIHG